MSSQASSRLKRLQIMALLFLLVAGIINFLDRTSLSIANTTIREEMGLTATEMGLLLSVFSFGYALCQLPIGMVMERFGVKKVYGFGIFLWSAAQTALGFVGSFSQMIVARIVLGIGESPHLPTGVKVVNDWYNIRQRGVPMGIVNMSSTLAQALAPPLLIAMMLAFGWRMMFIIIGVSGIILSILWFMFYRNREDAGLSAEDIAHLEEETPPSSKEKVTLRDWAGLFKQKSMWGMIIGFNGVGYMVWLFLTWLPSYLQTERGFDGGAIGFASALVAVVGVPGALFFSHLSDKFRDSKVKVILGLEIVAAAMLMFTVLSPNTTMLMISLVLYGLLGKMAVDPILISFVSEQASAKTLGRAFSLFNFFGMSSAVVAPTLTGFISDLTGSKEISFVMSAGLVITGTILFALITLRKNKIQSKTIPV